MVGDELRGVLDARYPDDPDVAEFDLKLRNLKLRNHRSES
jgi:hypothetical protein